MEKSSSETAAPKSYSGIPEAEFVEDVDKYMSNSEVDGNADKALRQLDEQHGKYKFMEYNLLSKKKRLKTQIPDLERSIEMIKMLQTKKDSPDKLLTHFTLSDQLYMKAEIDPTDKVCLWLGANVMLEYTLDDALQLLNKNVNAAKTSLGWVEHDLDFLRDQSTTTEVNMARVYNWNIKRKQAAAEAS